MFNLFDISLKINGFPLKEAKRELIKITQLSDESHIKFVKKKKHEIVNFHLQNNDYYKSFFGEKDLKNWEDIPIMTKKDLQKPLKERLSKNYSINNVYINKTSGSSGTPFIFAKCKYSHAMTWASNIYRFSWYQIDFNRSYQARFYGIPLDRLGYYKERLKDFLSHRYRFPIFNLSDFFLEKVLGKFRTSNFDYINGYTSSIVLFAEFLKRKNITLKSICPSLKVCIVTSEMLFEDDKLLLEKQLGIPIVNEYGASELDLIAFQSPNNDWLINTETLFIELLDEENKPVELGQPGRIVITSLYNKAHPFIRYDIGDIGVFDERSTCQKPILKKLIGRTNDVAILPSGKKSPGLTFYYVTKSIIKNDGNVKEFIIKQTKIDSFEIDYVSDKELSDENKLNIEKAIYLYLEPNLHFSYNRKSTLIRSKRGKLKQFESLL
ncbi:phenylacetate--CoA ligase family protein [Flavobacterium oreochromis]|uniref:phenylacetate--CoA ligase family protein n=1 Tax=Flavobacterium oreochromis TaxID=2906078 RepID=UPI00385A9ECF